MDYTITHDFGDVSHASDTDGTRCIYCDMTQEEAKQTQCPEYKPE